MKFNRSYPDSRMRRIRKSSGLRDMLAETTLSKSDLIQPIFIKESLKGTEEIKSMPGINRLGLDILDGEIEKIIDLGIKSIAVFPVIDDFLSNITMLVDNTVFSIFAWILLNPEPVSVYNVIMIYILGTYLLRIIIALLDTPFIYIAKFFIKKTDV